MDPAWEHAVTQGDVAVVCELLRRGVEVNARDRHGQTGLMLAWELDRCREEVRMLTPDYEISTDPGRIDIDAVHRYLSTSYWAHGRSRATVARSIQNSLCFGAYRSGQQIGFGRVITDFAVFAYLADIFVVPEFQRRGIGKALVRAMLEHPRLQGLQLVLLRTRDAQGLYAQFGFRTLSRPEEMMLLP